MADLMFFGFFSTLMLHLQNTSLSHIIMDITADGSLTLQVFSMPGRTPGWGDYIGHA